MGIANRAFERRFELADFVQVTGADLADGLLTIELAREIPEAMKPRKIDDRRRAAGDRSRPRPRNSREGRGAGVRLRRRSHAASGAGSFRRRTFRRRICSLRGIPLADSHTV